MCTRVLYETGVQTYMVGRTMDWSDMKSGADWWVFPRRMKRDGGAGEGSITWTSKYGSLVVSIYQLASCDGMNEAGLVGNMLYLAESDYGDHATSKKPKLSLGAWLQYVIDNFATVKEAVDALQADSLTVVTASTPNGQAGTAHLAISDPSGDSAILEYIEGKLQIHHSRGYKIMTNSPPYEQQLALNAYWDLVGGQNMLPGTIKAADRFVRASYHLKSSPKFADKRSAVAAILSQMRSISVPIGMDDPAHPNIASTLWRSVLDHEAKRYYFESVLNPAIFWVDLEKLDLKPGAQTMKLKLDGPAILDGDVSALFQPAEPFKFLAPNVPLGSV